MVPGGWGSQILKHAAHEGGNLVHNIQVVSEGFVWSRISNNLTPTGRADDEVCGATNAQITRDCGQVESPLVYPVAASLLKLIKPLTDHHGRVTPKQPAASKFVLRKSKEES